MSDRFQNRYRIPSARAAWWDYANNGAYFITIKTAGGEHCFGRVVTRKMNLSDIGTVAHKCWMDIPTHFPFVELGAFVVMPNHVHGIIIINKTNEKFNKPPYAAVNTPNLGVSTGPMEQNDPPEQNHPTETDLTDGKKQTAAASEKWKSGTLGVIVNQYKRACTLHARKIRTNFKWQPRYHDHIIRNDEEYLRISDYIESNPAKWEQDRHCRK